MRREINTSREAILAASAELEARVDLRTSELRSRNEELVALNELAGSLTRSLDARVILNEALDAVRAIHPLHAGRGYALDGDALVPVRKLTEASEVLASGRTDIPVPPQGNDEVGTLA